MYTNQLKYAGKSAFMLTCITLRGRLNPCVGGGGCTVGLDPVRGGGGFGAADARKKGINLKVHYI
jgi:hypothetical protein